jgi:FixJ family two-component response regulator
MPEIEPTVLLVDDDESLRKALVRLIGSAGYRVLAFSSALEFLESEFKDGPCCLVLDVQMPGLTGLDLQQEMKDRGLAYPIIFLTGHGDIPMSVRAMREGALNFLTKPVREDDLLGAIQEAIENSKQGLQERFEFIDLQNRLDSLTHREVEVFSLVVSGKLNKQIAYELDISEKTVKVHRGRVMHKMQTESLAGLVRMAARLGLIKIGDGPIK